MNPTVRQYSGFLDTIYDEPGAVGELGRGTHYSVLTSENSAAGTFKRIGVIWDEDHDVRVIHVIERLHMRRMLRDVMFIGERKGTLSVILRRRPPNFEKYGAVVNKISESLTDPWPANIMVWPDVGGIIHDDDRRVRIYLRNVASLWTLKPCNLDNPQRRLEESMRRLEGLM